MRRLDPRSIERLAAVVCDRNGANERAGWELQRLLEMAGWPEAPEYDGSPKLQWLAETLSEDCGDPFAMERLLCRVCDPIEYDDGAVTAEQFRQEINRVLAAERLEIFVVDGRPVLAEIDEGPGVPAFLPTDDLEERLRRLVQDQQAAELLASRAREAAACARSQAYTLTLIGIGSFVEGLLYTVLTERDPSLLQRGFRIPQNPEKRVSAENVSLRLLIDYAHECGLIQVDAKDFVHKVRDYRNLVHPRLQLELGLTPDDDTVMMCWGPVRAILNDLAVSMSDVTA